ncbi:MAG: 50S ribosomal protein L25, partial [Victivallales bacterium]|nr:50S ribosomal protein L25 [Victivallales bacterium]
MSKVKHVLNIVARETSGKGASRRLRHQGMIPAVIYSLGQPGRTIALNSGEWRSLMQNDVKLVHLLEDGEDRHLAVIQEVQEDFLRGIVVHVDFMEVDVDKMVMASIPIHFVNAPAATDGALLEQPLHELHIEAKPADLLESITVDVAGLVMDAPICVKDIKVADGVRVLNDPEAIVFHLVRPAAEVAAEAAAEPEAAPEVAAKAEAGTAK